MKNIFRMSLDDVLEIVRLRDKRKLSWDNISGRMGYTSAACSKHYHIYKSPEPKFYMSEFHKALKHLDLGSISVADAHKMAKSMGYAGTLASFRNRTDIIRLPFKYSTKYNTQCIEAIKEELKTSNKSLRDLVWEYFPNYTYSWKLQLLKRMSEINYE